MMMMMTTGGCQISRLFVSTKLRAVFLSPLYAFIPIPFQLSYVVLLWAAAAPAEESPVMFHTARLRRCFFLLLYDSLFRAKSPTQIVHL